MHQEVLMDRNLSTRGRECSATMYSVTCLIRTQCLIIASPFDMSLVLPIGATQPPAAIASNFGSAVMHVSRKCGVCALRGQNIAAGDAV
jgi:hypothetical protein